MGKRKATYMNEEKHKELKVRLDQLNKGKIELLNSIVVYQYEIGNYELVKKCEKQLELLDIEIAEIIKQIQMDRED
jgi:exonuclease VII small subunit